MPGGTLGLSITFALACASSTFFLLMRCHGTGRPFGRSSRNWALLVIVVTSLISTGAAFAGKTLVDHLPLAFLGVGLVGPSGLWLSEIRNRRDERRGPAHDMSTLWLSWLLARLQEAIVEDRMTWCEQRLDNAWSADELGMAARFYQDYLQDHLSAEECRRGGIYAQLTAIENRLTIVRLIENSSGRPKVAAALRNSQVTKEARYKNHLDDLARMADVLRHDAERDLIRLLGFAYGAGYYRMPVFVPRPRVWAVTPVIPVAPVRPTRASRQPQIQP